MLEKHVDPYKIDEEGVYPGEALDALAAIGLFGMKIPKEYGGLGFSVTNYARVVGLIGSYCAKTVTSSATGRTRSLAAWSTAGARVRRVQAPRERGGRSLWRC